MSGASGITTKGSVTKSFSSVTKASVKRNKGLRRLGYSTLCVLRHDAIQDVFSRTYMYKTKFRCVFYSSPFPIRPNALTKRSDSERLDHVTTTTTASSSFSSVKKASVKRNKGLRRLVVFKRTVRIGHPHTLDPTNFLPVSHQSDAWYSKGPLRLVTLTRNSTNFRFPNNQIRGTQKDRYDWSPSVTLGVSLARSHKSKGGARSELSVSIVHSGWQDGQPTDGNPRGSF